MLYARTTIVPPSDAPERPSRGSSGGLRRGSKGLNRGVEPFENRNSAPTENMTGHHCPECDFGEDEEKSLQSVRSHITSSGDPDHDWDELADVVETQGADDDDDADLDEEDGDDVQEDTDEDEQPDATDDDPEDDDMPTDEEYERQHGESSTETTDDADEDDAGDDGAPSSSSSSTDGGAFSVPALDGNTTLILLGIAAIAILALLVLSRDGDDTISEEPTTDDGDAVSNEEVTLVEQ